MRHIEETFVTFLTGEEFMSWWVMVIHGAAECFWNAQNINLLLYSFMLEIEYC
jgi:hypothetical protein